jgi:hypothetical protein
VVFTDTDVLTGHDRGAALSDDNFTDADGLAVCTLNTEKLRI